MDLHQQIRQVLSKHLNLSEYKVFIFGSRAKGEASDRSDIDIGIEGEKKLSPRVKFSIEDDLEKIPTLYKIDIVDFSTVSPEFKEEALKYYRTIN